MANLLPSQTQHDIVWDFLRGVAMIAVLALHACGPYLARPLTGLLWPVWQSGRTIDVVGAQLALTDAVFWVCRGFAIPLFCFISGVFAARTIATSGRAQFVSRRFRRLGIPLLVGTLIVLPLMYFIWAVGWVHIGWAKWAQIPHGRFGRAIKHNLFGFCHFWFLWYTLLYCVTLAAAWPLVKRLVTWPSCTRRLMLSPVLWCLLACVGGACVWAMPSAIMYFPNSFLLAPGFFAYHAIFFAWGVLASQYPFAGAQGRPWLGVAMVGSAVVLGIVLTALIGPGLLLHANKPPPLRLTDQRLLLIGACATLQAILMINGLPRLSRFNAANWLSAVGRRSLWIYSTHLIWVGLGAVGLYGVAIMPELKALILFIVAIGLPHYTHRIAAKTRVGRWLGAVLPQ